MSSSNPSQSLQGTNDKLLRKYISLPAEPHPLPLPADCLTVIAMAVFPLSIIEVAKAVPCEDALNHNAVANLVTEDKFLARVRAHSQPYNGRVFTNHTPTYTSLSVKSINVFQNRGDISISKVSNHNLSVNVYACAIQESKLGGTHRRLPGRVNY